MTSVLDASVAYKWFIEEEGSDRAIARLEKTDLIVAPDLIIPEVCNATWKAMRRGIITRPQQDHAVRHVAAAFDLLFPTAALGKRAVEISRSLDHPVYDCFYLALSEQQDARMVTFDTRLLRSVNGSEWARYVEAC